MALKAALHVHTTGSDGSLTSEEVVQIHTGSVYPVYMLGFIPGFTYLGELSPQIAVPRLKIPRTRVPQGSVGIGGSQTGMYAAESPGGWQIIGRTPLRLFDPRREPPALLEVGSYVRFVRITPREFIQVGKDIERGTYRVQKEVCEVN